MVKSCKRYNRVAFILRCNKEKYPDEEKISIKTYNLKDAATSAAFNKLLAKGMDDNAIKLKLNKKTALHSVLKLTPTNDLSLKMKIQAWNGKLVHQKPIMVITELLKF